MAGLDDKDRKIIGLLQQEPHASQSEIAASADLSQPAVSLRIKRLTEQGFLSRSVGVNMHRLDLPLAKLEVALHDGQTDHESFYRCPYIVDVLHLADAARLSLFMIGETKTTIQSLAARLQERNGLELLHLDTVTAAQNELIHPLQLSDGEECSHCICPACEHYTEQRCTGCPLTPLYRGELW